MAKAAARPSRPPIGPLDSSTRDQRELVTPEGVDLRLQLATVGQRGAALFIDLAIMLTAVIAVTVVACSFAVQAKEVIDGAFIFWSVTLFLLRNFYFIGFEMTARGATPGKRALGIRVAARNGGRLTADAVIARNFMREIEIYLPLSLLVGGMGDGWLRLLGILWCLIFVLFPLFNKDRLRVGDMAAGTWVIRAPRKRLLKDLAEDGVVRLGGFAFTPAQIDAYGVHELHVLEEVLRASDKRTQAAVASRIRLKIGWIQGPSELDSDFLSAYYAALRRRLEQRLLFGHRRKDKHDKA